MTTKDRKWFLVPFVLWAVLAWFLLFSHECDCPEPLEFRLDDGSLCEPQVVKDDNGDNRLIGWACMNEFGTHPEIRHVRELETP